MWLSIKLVDSDWAIYKQKGCKYEVVPLYPASYINFQVVKRLKSRWVQQIGVECVPPPIKFGWVDSYKNSDVGKRGTVYLKSPPRDGLYAPPPTYCLVLSTPSPPNLFSPIKPVCFRSIRWGRALNPLLDLLNSLYLVLVCGSQRKLSFLANTRN